MASIEALPVETIYHIVDMCAEETIIDTELSTKAQWAWAQTSRRSYATIYTLIRPTVKGTPLHYAIMNGHRDILEFLVEVGVDPHIPSTRLCLDCYEPGAFYALHMAISHSKIKGAAQLLIEKLGAYKTLKGSYAFGLEERMLARHDLDASVRGSYGCTPLFDAVSCGRLKTVKSLLQRPEADASIAGRNGHTPLHEAVEISNLPIVEVLLQRPEVDVTTTDDDKCTPLHRAAFHAAVDITKLLLEQPGVDVASSDSEGMTPLHQAISGRTHIFWHCKGGDTEAKISDLVDEALENIKILLAHPEMNAGLHDKKGLTPLHQACLIGDWEVAELLLQRGDVDPNARALNGQKPLHVAVSCTSSRALKLVGRLLEQPGVEITDCDFDGRTILHYIGGSLPKDWETTPIVETALREGVPIDQISTNGLTALHQTINAGNYPFANLLLSLGADPMVSKRFKYNNSLLHLCFKYHPFYEQHRDEVVEKLIAEGIEINTYTDSPLTDFDADWDEPEIDEGMRHESVEGLQSMILANGMDCTPLMLTVTESMKIESMKMLLNAGADPNAHVTIRQRKHGKIRDHRVAFLSGVLYQAWKDGPSDYSIDPIDEHLKLLLEHGSRIDFDGPGDSPLQEACKASEDRYEAFLETLLDHSTARNVSQEHVRELICEYEKKPEHEKVLAELRAFEDRIFSN
ncbi:Ankyrin-3 [Fusarium culmorum]|uniref:Ankyrin-3 n=1 Tax=Fusarium culmorum TaxID=5516 RepID=A0A2T4H1Q3_FUSCU|nr:Ankyrin-3 [Fusarium culmorum]